jgi:hypothetical protein
LICELFFIGRLFITALNLFLTLDMFTLFISLWFNFSRVHEPRNFFVEFSIYFRLCFQNITNASLDFSDICYIINFFIFDHSNFHLLSWIFLLAQCFSTLFIFSETWFHIICSCSLHLISVLTYLLFHSV